LAHALPQVLVHRAMSARALPRGPWPTSRGKPSAGIVVISGTRQHRLGPGFGRPGTRCRRRGWRGSLRLRLRHRPADALSPLPWRWPMETPRRNSHLAQAIWQLSPGQPLPQDHQRPGGGTPTSARQAFARLGADGGRRPPGGDAEAQACFDGLGPRLAGLVATVSPAPWPWGAGAGLRTSGGRPDGTRAPLRRPPSTAALGHVLPDAGSVTARGDGLVREPCGLAAGTSLRSNKLRISRVELGLGPGAAQMGHQLIQPVVTARAALDHPPRRSLASCAGPHQHPPEPAIEASACSTSPA